MKILVVFTGGTIGSSISNEGYFSPDEVKKYRLIELYKSNTDDDDVTFETVSPYFILSEQLKWDNVRELIACIGTYLDKDYDGIIVTHGTDTLQYTSAALSYAFGLKCIPIVLVSSNYILDDNRMNGLSNFTAAVDIIKAKACRGVLVAYKNDGFSVRLHRASRLLAHEAYNDKVSSLLGSEMGYILGHDYVANPEYTEKSDELCSLNELSALNELPGKSEDKFSSKVLNIQVHPFLAWDSFNLEGIKAVLISAYHSGTLDTDNDIFIDFMKKASSLGIPVFLVGAIKEAVYESKKTYDELKINVLPVMSPITAFVKLSMLESIGLDPVCNMNKSLGGDIYA